jgi:hypothetical protein
VFLWHGQHFILSTEEAVLVRGKIVLDASGPAVDRIADKHSVQMVSCSHVSIMTQLKTGGVVISASELTIVVLSVS